MKLLRYLLFFVSTAHFFLSNNIIANKHDAGSVLPLITKTVDGKKVVYAFLGREGYGADKGTYDDFGGAADPGETPLQSAARECSEEMISHKTISMSVQEIEKYIAPQAGNTKYVITQKNVGTKKSNMVTYITYFPEHLIDQCIDRFYTEKKFVKQHKYREKDRLALVEWDLLKKTIAQGKKTVKAIVIDSKQQRQQKKISLRPILCCKLKQFCQNKSCKGSKN
ncbi:hypothetical protein KC460_04145 [Candidatus Dependentiae bacterium]|nr:hypothetical protein [Candidatus Dependentiae bacterium]